MTDLPNCIAWSDHQAFLSKGIRSIYKSTRYTDIEIRCFSESFRAHRLILNIFTDYFKSCDELWLRLEIKPIYMRAILDFIYKGEVLIDQTDVEGFLATCKVMRINLFKDFVQNPPQPADPDEEEDVRTYQNRYELCDFQMLCKNCYKCFPTEKHFKKHFWQCMKKRDMKCRFCDKKFRLKFDIDNHERIHTGERPFLCEREGCDLYFKEKSHMRNHVRQDHDMIRYQCDQCHKIYKTPNGFKNHVRDSHHGDIKFSCQECLKGFYSEKLLKLHMKSGHRKVKSMVSCERDGCSRQFPTSFKMKRHVRTDHDLVRFSCDQCDRAFKRKDTLINHVESKHSDVNYPCTVCAHPCSSKENLYNHMRRTHRMGHKIKLSNKTI